MNKFKFYLISGLLLMFTSCSSMKKSTILGIGLGAGTGAITPLIFQSKNAKKMQLKGALIGAGIGALAAYIIHGQLVNRDERVRKETLFNLKKFDVIYEPETQIFKGGNFNE